MYSVFWASPLAAFRNNCEQTNPLGALEQFFSADLYPSGICAQPPANKSLGGLRAQLWGNKFPCGLQANLPADLSPSGLEIITTPAEQSPSNLHLEYQDGFTLVIKSVSNEIRSNHFCNKIHLERNTEMVSLQWTNPPWTNLSRWQHFGDKNHLNQKYRDDINSNKKMFFKNAKDYTLRNLPIIRR